MSDEDVDFGGADRQRDRRLRRRMLSTLHLARIGPGGGLGGRVLRDLVDGAMPSTQQTTDDDHALGLVRDLVAKGLATETDQRTHKRQRFSLDHLFFRVTAKGSSLWNETIPPDPDVEDQRIAKGE
jgi:hypothetical protein